MAALANTTNILLSPRLDEMLGESLLFAVSRNTGLPSDSMKPKKLKCHEETLYPVHRAARSKKPHTIAEEIILPSTINIVSVMVEEARASKPKAIPLSDNTTARCIHDISKDIFIGAG